MPQPNYHIDIDSYIGYPITKGYVRSKLEPLKGVPVNVRVNSYGGDVQTAFDIRQQFIDHGDVTVYVYGMTASAATILAMGAKKVVMSRYALMLVHQCSSYVEQFGSFNADQLASAIEELQRTKTDNESIDHVIAGIYAERTGKDINEMAQVMKAARWLTAEECLDLGLIDSVLEEESTEDPLAITAQMREHFTACGLPLPTERTPVTYSDNTSCASMPVPEAPAFSTELAGAKGQPGETPCNEPSDMSIRQIFARLKAMILGAHDDDPAPDTNTTEIPDMNIQDLTPIQICTVLQQESLRPSADGTVALTAEQLQSIEDALTDAGARASDAQMRIAQLEAQVAALGAADGADTAPVDNASETLANVLPGQEAVDFYHKFKNII